MNDGILVINGLTFVGAVRLDMRRFEFRKMAPKAFAALRQAVRHQPGVFSFMYYDGRRPAVDRFRARWTIGQWSMAGKVDDADGVSFHVTIEVNQIGAKERIYKT